MRLDFSFDNAPEPEYATERELLALEDLTELHRERARYDPAAFNSYVLRDEETGLPIVPSPAHEEWQRLATRHRRLLIWSHVEAGKTHQLSVGRTLYELGRNPRLRAVVLTNTHGLAQAICGLIARYIEKSPELHEVFPDLRRDPERPWNHHQLFVVRDEDGRVGPKDPSVQTCGVHGNIMGNRIDLLIVDDILDQENASSPTQREDVFNWFMATVEGRLSRNSRIIFIGNAWHTDDIMHRLAKYRVWFAVRYPVLNEAGESIWPERWPLERIEEKRAGMTAPEFNRQFMCRARSEEDARFQRAWVEKCLDRGRGRTLVWALQAVPEGYRVFTGVDLSMGKQHKASHLTSLFTIAVAPNDDRIVLDVVAGKWGGPEIVERIMDVHERYHSIVVVESNAAQEFILQFTRRVSAVPVVPYHTTAKVFRNHELGIESLATEMANGKWVIPCDQARQTHPEVAAWLNDVMYYTPDKHPGDRLMASFFAREGARRTRPRAGVKRIDLMRR